MPATPRAGDGGKPTPPPHPTSLAVWGVPSPVVVNRHFRVTVGVKCADACPLAGQRVVVHDETGAEVGNGRLGESPAPGTHALYAAEVTLTAPAREGVHSWTAAFAPESRPGTPAESGAHASAYSGPPAAAESAHAVSQATFGFRAAAPPEHRVCVTVRDRDTGAPLQGVEVCVGAYRASTGESGRASVEVPGGRYDLYTRKAGYAAHTGSATVDRDVTLEVAAAPASDTDLDDDQLWM